MRGSIKRQKLLSDQVLKDEGMKADVKHSRDKCGHGIEFEKGGYLQASELNVRRDDS
jgi:hypothetical protein